MRHPAPDSGLSLATLYRLGAAPRLMFSSNRSSRLDAELLEVLDLSVFSRQWRFKRVMNRALGRGTDGRAGVQTRARSMALGDAPSVERRVGVARGANG